MTDALSRVLDHLGYDHRPEQDRLFEALEANEKVLLAQAGTGTGKSIAVLAAAADAQQRYGVPSVVVVPTNVLMTQYVTKDAPAVQDALGVDIRALKGRAHYLCASSPGMRHAGEREPEYRGHLLDDERGFEVESAEYGCPGSDECRYDPDDPAEWPCQYRVAKDALADADVIITNAHILYLDRQLKAAERSILPEYGALFVDEAHTLEDIVRGFTTSSINQKAVRDMGHGGRQMADLLESWKRAHRFSVNVWGAMIGPLIPALTAVRDWMPESENARPSQKQWDVKNAAKRILEDGEAGTFDAGHRVLWFDPGVFPGYPKLQATQITLSGTLGTLLRFRAHPTALVSATIPASTAKAYGIPDATFLDVGHPFDYTRQARIGISAHSGAHRDADSTATARAAEMLELIRSVEGGVLLLFSSFKDLLFVHRQIGREITKLGRKTYLHESGVNRQELGDAFKADGRGVLFGSDSFATGFDAPGTALQAVGIWKLPYPGLDPVTKAIQQQSRQRYEDAMRMKMVQAIGRLIRTSSDTGVVWVADSRAKRLMFDPDQMTHHLRDYGVFSLSGAAKSP